MENVMKGTLLSRVCSFAVCRNNTTGKAHFKEVSNHLDILIHILIHLISPDCWTP